METHFLPDKDRAAAEVNMRSQLKEEWMLRQQVRPVTERYCSKTIASAAIRHVCAAQAAQNVFCVQIIKNEALEITYR